MDIYLAYKCKFCIRTAGFGGVPKIFRKPLVIIEGPLLDLEFGNPKNLLLSPHYYSIKKGKTLSLSETFAFRASDIRISQEYKNLGIEVKNNTSEEIKDVVIEMAERLEGIWKPNSNDIFLQKKFLEIFEKNLIFYKKRNYFGNILSKYSAKFIRNNPHWLG